MKAAYKIDPAHSTAQFVVRHMMITNVRGGFSGVQGTVVYDPENPTASSVEVMIDANMINTLEAAPESFVRAGMLGLPLMVAIIGGEPKRFRPLIDLYREAGRRAGHSRERLTVGLHSIGFLAPSTDEAAEIFYPGYAHTFTEIGKERGWPAATRAQFDALRGPTGALLIGDAKTVAKKILYVNEVLGGISRVTFQMGVSTLPHEKMLDAIEILGTVVAPIVRNELGVTPVRA